MDNDHNDSSDASTPRGPAAAPPDDAALRLADRLRRRKLDEHRARSLRRADPLLANLALINNDLMGLCHEMKIGIDRTLLAEKDMLASKTLPGAITAFMKMAKHVVQMSAIELRHGGGTEDPTVAVVAVESESRPPAARPDAGPQEDGGRD